MSFALAADIRAAFPEVPTQVLTAIGNTDRRPFLAPEWAHLADRAGVPIPRGDVTTCPFIVARMVAAALDGREAPLRRVLEVGTGSGWQTALLAQLAAQVDSIEANSAVAIDARARLTDWTAANVLHADGLALPPECEGYDAIVVCAAARSAGGLSKLRARLALGGVLVAPIGVAFTDQAVYRMTAGGPPELVIPRTRFVPLRSTS